MIEDWLLAIVPNLMVAVFSGALGYLAWRDSSKLYRRYFAFTAWTIAAMSLLVIPYLFISDLTLCLVLIVIEYAIDVAILLELFLFITSFTGVMWFRGRKKFLGLVAFGAITPILVATNGWHHLFFTSTRVLDKFGMHILDMTYGPGLSVWVAFCILILGSSVLILMVSIFQAPKDKVHGYAYIAVALTAVIAASVLYWISDTTDPRIDIFTGGLFIGVVLVYYGTFWRDLLDAPPMTVIQLLDNVTDGTVLLDENGRIAYWNPAARDALTDRSGHPLPKDLWLKAGPEYELTLAKEGRTIIWNVRVSRMDDAGRSPGTILLLRDITERKSMETALIDTNNLLSVMQSVNRHDLRNDAVALAGFLELVEKENGSDPRIRQAKKILNRMMLRIDQVGGLAKMNTREAIWQDAGRAAWDALHPLEDGKLTMKVELNGLEVLSDQLLERIFYNLAENTVRHGKGAGWIEVSYFLKDEDCIICYQDDGIGIPPGQKELIFEKGFGVNTGMGLYLTKEMAHMNGIDIIENGTDGARFELTIPSGRWRWTKNGSDDLAPGKAKG